MNLRHLKYFVATAETGQVSRAARALSISQSAVTGAITDLEREVGTELFSRSPRGMEPTAAGREFLSGAYEILSRLDEMRALARRSSSLSAKVRLAATYTVMGYFLPRHLERLARLHPNLEIDLLELNRAEIEISLREGSIDIALLLTSNLDAADLASETLLRSPRRLWVASGHRFASRTEVGFDEIAQCDYIMLTVDEAAQTTRRYWSGTGHAPRIRLETSAVEAVRSMVANDRGVTILSDMVHRPFSLEGRRIRTVTTSMPVPTMDVGLAWRRGVELGPGAELLAHYFRYSFDASLF
ncbi:MAG: DNA-binding transcriptional LysR family regulator [Limimaricola cinnabarinus]|jgi:DNA-binding transcriptional LysR family regulator|uniref:LysR family transcriptional regulator n=1 Tax=Limimaricola cinnabarinus TaxID=1125964 RepID=UPI0039E72A23